MTVKTVALPYKGRGEGEGWLRRAESHLPTRDTRRSEGGIRISVASVGRLLVLLHVALCAGLARPVGSETIHGHVDVRLRLAAPQRAPSVARLGSTQEPLRIPDRAGSVVYLETAPLGAFERPALARARMDQHGEAFVPYVLPVSVGTTVDFPNNDPIFHNVFSLSKTRRFDLGRYAAGRSKSVRFDRPGIVRVFCEIHSHMSAFILVFAHRFFAATDDAGRYEIGGVPPGRYAIVAWTDGRVRERREIAIEEGAGRVRADFTVE